MIAKDYSYFQEVINIVNPYLEKENIKILHLGQDSSPLDNTLNLNNKTSISQCAFIIKRSLLHFGNDSWMCHYAGAEDIPLVSLYGPTTINNHSPFFYNKDKTIFLESHRNGNKATFSREENPKTIDFIHSEDVAAAVLKLLNIPYILTNKTLFIGNLYNNKMVHSIPNQIVDTNRLGLQSLIVRMDIDFNEENLIKQ